MKHDRIKEVIGSSKSYTEIINKLNMELNFKNYEYLISYTLANNISTKHLGDGGKKRKYKVLINEVFIINNKKESNIVKTRLLNYGIVENKCSICNIIDWQNIKIALHLDHINGINTDNQLNNLRLLCPNCHSQTDTFRSLNRDDVKNKITYTCLDCQKEITSGVIRCNSCNGLHKIGKR